MKKFSKIFKNAILISIFATISIIMTAMINYYTKNQILHRIQEEKKILLKQVISCPLYNSFDIRLLSVKNKLLGDEKNHNVWLLYKKNKAQAAVVESLAPDGYSGSIHLLVAAYFNGKIIGVRVFSHHETPGIGDKIEVSISNWIMQFRNMFVLDKNDKHILLKKFGGDIEQFTGATITPQSVTNAIHRTVMFIKTVLYNTTL